MARAKWKGPCVDPTLLNKTNNFDFKSEIQTTSRNSEILPNFVDKTFKIHAGNSYTTILVNEEMIGHKFGEFAFTRKRFVFKKKNK